MNLNGPKWAVRDIPDNGFSPLLKHLPMSLTLKQRWVRAFEHMRDPNLKT